MGRGLYYEDEWYEAEEPYVPDYEDAAFDDEAIYYGGEDEFNEDYDGYEEDAASMAEAYDSAYATYMDARQRFQQLKLARGYLPVVALTDGQTAASSSSTTPTGRGKGHDKGRGKGKGKSKVEGEGLQHHSLPSIIRRQGRSKRKSKSCDATASMTCLRCGQLAPLGRLMSTECQRKLITQQQASSSKHHRRLKAWLLLRRPPWFSFRMSMDKIIPKQRCWILVLPPFLSGYGPFKRYVEHSERAWISSEHHQVRSL